MTAVKNHIKIVGYGTHLPRNTVTFKDQTRYRVVENEETQLSMAVKAIEKALEQAGLTIKDIVLCQPVQWAFSLFPAQRP